MISLDTNVLARFLARDDEEQFRAASAVMAGLAADRRAVVTQIVLVELFWVLTRTYRLPAADVLGTLLALVETRELDVEGEEDVVVALDLAADGADFPDALIQARSARLGCEAVVTFDSRAVKSLGWRLIGH